MLPNKLCFQAFLCCGKRENIAQFAHFKCLAKGIPSFGLGHAEPLSSSPNRPTQDKGKMSIDISFDSNKTMRDLWKSTSRSFVNLVRYVPIFCRVHLTAFGLISMKSPFVFPMFWFIEKRTSNTTGYSENDPFPRTKLSLTLLFSFKEHAGHAPDEVTFNEQDWSLRSLLHRSFISLKEF